MEISGKFNLVTPHRHTRTVGQKGCAVGCERFTTLALTALKAAIDAGYDNFEHLQQDADLAALREHPDFKTLLPGDDSAKR